MIAAILIVVAVTFALRLIPAALWPGDSSDAGYHLLLRRAIRENGMKMPRKVAAMGLDEAQRYPWFYHTLIACLPERILLRCPALVSTITDSLMAVLAMLLVMYVMPTADVRGNAPLFAGLLVATSTALLAAGVGPRSYEVTPRGMGEFFFSAALLLGAMYSREEILWVGAAAAVLLGLSFLSSKFTVQVAVFCLPVMSLLAKSWLPLALLAAGFIAAVVLSGGRWLDVLRAQLHHLDIYRRRIMHDHDSIQHRNDLAAIRHDLVTRWRAAKNLREALFSVLMTLEKFTLFIGMARNLVWVLVAVPLLTYLWRTEWFPGDGMKFIDHTFGGPHLDHWMDGWLLAPLVPFMLTSLRPFLFIGEAERYLEYAVLPAAYFFAGICSHSFGASGWLVVAFTFLFLVYTWRRMKLRAGRSSGDEGSLVKFLASLPDGRRILPVSQGLGFRLAWQLRHVFLITIDGVVWRRDYDQLFWKYPWISTDLGWWVREKGAELLVVDRRQFAALSQVAAKYDLSPYPVAFQNESFEVRRLAP